MASKGDKFYFRSYGERVNGDVMDLIAAMDEKLDEVLGSIELLKRRKR